MRLTKKMADNGRCYLSGLAEVSNYYPKGYGRIQVGHAVEKLAEYEDLEEQGKLLKLPCAVGDTIYRVSPHGVCVDICQITGFAECDSVKSMCYTVYIDPDEKDIIPLSDIGKTVFLTQEEAESALKALEA